MTSFEPIAIVGRSCVLPGALNPEQLWNAVVEGRDLVSTTPEGRWRAPDEDVLCSPNDDPSNKSWSNRGGYVRGFETVWNPEGFAIAADEFNGLDEGMLWAAHCAREALRDAGYDQAPARTSAVYGNLGFPSEKMTEFAEGVWFGGQTSDPRNRFMSANSAETLQRALNLSSSYCLDTACASSLYAIKLACDQLHDGSVDVALAGAVNRSDDLFIHVGFTALKAMSKSGQSRPFHAGADGLVPAEGAGFVALKRLSDARRDGDKVHGIIRGVGLSNDGRGRGFLAPSEDGQARAIQQAYDVSGVSPSQVSLLECHATGTSVGDAAELKSTASVYAGVDEVPIGSLKSNMGHLITAAGVAGLIKVLEAMRHGQRPPTLHALKDPNPALKDVPFRTLDAAEPWTSNGPKIAGVSAFGFGGNNAHLVVSEDVELPVVSSQRSAAKCAIVGVSGLIGDAGSIPELIQTLNSGQPVSPMMNSVAVELKELKFPPNDLGETIPQQLAVLTAARQAVGMVSEIDNVNAGVFMAMEPDIEVCRYGARWRLKAQLRKRGLDPESLGQSVDEMSDSIVATLTPAGVVGTMPNIPANRLNSQFDFGGASISVSEGTRSGSTALHLAMRALETGELNAALVCGVDLSCADVHVAALNGANPGDAAVAFVLKRFEDAQAAGDTIYATIERGNADGPNLDGVLGQSFAAGELRDLVVSTFAGGRGAIPGFVSTKVTEPPTPQSNGPALDFDAHKPPMNLALPMPTLAKPIGAALSTPSEVKPMNSDTTMPAAPTLPPVGTVPPAPEVLPPAPAMAQAAAAPVVAAAPMVAAAPVAAAPQQYNDPRLAAVHQTLTEIADLQNQYLIQQTAMYERFMDVQRSAMDLLANGGAHGLEAGGLVARGLEARGLEARGLEARSSVTTPKVPTQPAPPQIKNQEPTTKNQEPKKPAPTPVKNQEPKTKNQEPSKPAKPKVSPGLSSAPLEVLEPTGPTFNFEQLEIHASGKISEIYGEMFKVQDDYFRQVRMPEAPLLLADRVTGLDAEPGSMGTGIIWTESDVEADRWFMHQGYMPAGIMIESGQADLMLISYLGVDFTNRSERCYRLLGCELTYYGGLPTPGETLKYQIHLDGHAKTGGTRLMFFHYDCRVDDQVRLAVRKGQAGFFTDEELADSDGCLWWPEQQEIVENPRLDAPFIECQKSEFSKTEIEAFADGRPWDCFGEDFFWAKTHTRTPRIQNGNMLFHEHITDYDVNGGPWGRGYLKSTVKITPDHWFFDGHFKNDPCMPGTLMFEGCLQLMSFYLGSLGYTMERDGWTFQPVEGIPFQLNCRGQVTPESNILTYEVFVEEVWDGPEPTLYADLLCIVDGLKAFHARRVALKLTPGWPLDEGDKLLEGYEETKEVANDGMGHDFDYRSMLACANGRPSEAFGSIYDPFDSPLRVARLPNPPYHFLSRVTRTKGIIGSMEKGMEVDVEYDIPDDAWYFDENGCRAMPFAVLLEAALQPCGWLASYLGCALTVENKELFFRNLDGTGTLHVDLIPGSGTLLTKVKSTNISKTGPMIIVSFDVECSVDGVPVYDMDTVFGFFPAEALQNQIGLPTTDEQRALLEAPTNGVIDFTKRPNGYWNAGSAKLAEPMMLMVDRVEYFDPKGGEAGLGTLRGVKDVDPGEWFFKAHFFQDPVQPGSLGIEAMIQLLQFYMLETGMAEGIENARFETLSHAHPMTWKYRGQVIPHNKLIQSTMEITEVGKDDDGIPYAVGNASLWVDGKRIYEAFNMGMRIVSDGHGDLNLKTLDPAEDTWLNDHCPTYTLPALPMMNMVDLLAQGASIADPVVELRDVRVKGWLTFEGPRTLRTERNAEDVKLLVVQDDGAETEVASAKVFTSMYGQRPEAWPALEGDKLPLPYEGDQIFHGPDFHVVTSLVRTAEGASSTLQVRDSVPAGRLNPLLLDGATHGIPHDNLSVWGDQFDSEKVAYPAVIPKMEFFSETPLTGEVRCEVRPDGFLGSPDFPRFKVQLIDKTGVWCQFELVEACFPKGTLGSADPEDRAAFLRDHKFIEGLSISDTSDAETKVTEEQIAGVDWLPGTVNAVYGSREPASIAMKEHLARYHKVHPGLLPSALPLTRFDLAKNVDGDTAIVKGDAAGHLDITPVREFWTKWFGVGRWPVEDLYYGLIERFVNRVIIEDPAAWEAVKGRSLCYLGNHQVGVESLLFSIVASGLSQVPTVTLAKAEHRHTWLGTLIKLCFEYPDVKDPQVITFFDRDDKESLPAIIKELAAPGRSVMVHVEGTRSLSARTPVEKMSGAFIDMAMGVNAPVVPIRFVGGLPSESLETRLEFPLGFGKQDIYIGKPLLPEELAQMDYGSRKKLVIERINALGPDNAVEEAIAGDEDFEKLVLASIKKFGITAEDAVLREVLAEQADPIDSVKSLLAASSIEDVTAATPAETEWMQKLAQRLVGSK